jgi:hypothetical protein
MNRRQFLTLAGASTAYTVMVRVDGPHGRDLLTGERFHLRAVPLEAKGARMLVLE